MYMDDGVSNRLVRTMYCRDAVMALSAIHDPEGASIRKAHRLHRPTYTLRTATMDCY